MRAVLQANRQTSEVKLSGIPLAFEEPVEKGNVKRVVKICTSKVWDLTGGRAYQRGGMLILS